MIDTNLFLKGLLIGFSIAAPVGPIGVLCIRRTLSQGRLAGLVSGLGAATADAFYGCLAGFGLTAITDLLIEQQDWLGIIGGLFLCYLGIKNLLAKAHIENNPTTTNNTTNNTKSLPGAYATTLTLTLTNPITILSFAAIFAGLGLAESAAGASNSYAAAGLLVGGVFTGSALWWLSLSFGVGLLRNKVTPKIMLWINRISGLIILSFGLLALFRSF